MAESNRRRLERLEQLAHVSVGDVQVDVAAAISLKAEVLDAQIKAFEGVCRAHAAAGVWSQYGPASSRSKLQEEHRRYKLSEPLAIKERFTELRQSVETYGAGPSVHAVLARARAFLNNVT